jgi:hypothetical protein
MACICIGMTAPMVITIVVWCEKKGVRAWRFVAMPGTVEAVRVLSVLLCALSSASRVSSVPRLSGMRALSHLPTVAP